MFLKPGISGSPALVWNIFKPKRKICTNWKDLDRDIDDVWENETGWQSFWTHLDYPKIYQNEN